MTETIGDLLFSGEKKLTGEVGIELECEGSKFSEYFENDYWRAEFDGSLRGDSREYVLNTPCKISEVPKVISSLVDHLERDKTKVRISDRTGTHVHLNIRDLTSTQLITFICVYLVLEELIVSTCGPNRQGNHFCFRAIDAEAGILALAKSLKKDNFRSIIRDDYRYSALNLLPTFKFGSVEFRALQTEVGFSNVLPIVKILKAIKTFSKRVEDPREVINNFSGIGMLNMMQTILGKSNCEFIYHNSLLNETDYERSIFDGIRIAQDVAFSREDWGTFTLVNTKYHPKESIGDPVRVRPARYQMLHTPRLEENIIGEFE